jgi:hypothetical protein
MTALHSTTTMEAENRTVPQTLDSVQQNVPVTN